MEKDNDNVMDRSQTVFPPTSLVDFFPTKKTARLSVWNRAGWNQAARDSDFNLGIPNFATRSALIVTLLHHRHRHLRRPRRPPARCRAVRVPVDAGAGPAARRILSASRPSSCRRPRPFLARAARRTCRKRKGVRNEWHSPRA